MNRPVFTVDALKREVLPELFASPARLGEYGAMSGGTGKLLHLSNLMEGGCAGALADKITEILGMMADASPQTLSKAPTWLERLLGAAVEMQVRYRAARHTLDRLLREAEGCAQGVRDTVVSIDQLIDSHTLEGQQLTIFIQAGREFLNENTTIGAVADGSLAFDRPRERLARKLANLATLLASHELSVSQMTLSRAQAVDMLDRFSETVSVLVPVWRQHSLSLISTQHMNPGLVRQASRAHQALMASLSQSLDGMNHQ